MAIGAVLAARMITLKKSVRVIPLGIAMGVGVIVMIGVRDMWLAAPLLVLIGIFSGCPKVAQVEEKMNFLQPAAIIASARFSPPTTLLLK